MASGLPGGGDFYSATGYGGVSGGFVGGGRIGTGVGGSMMNMNMNMNNIIPSSSSSSLAAPSQIIHQQLQPNYMSLMTQTQSSQPLIHPRTANHVPKRSLSEQQQAAFLRSVKQRSQYNHTSPISPFDFSSGANNTNNNINSPLFRSLSISPNNGGGAVPFNPNPNPSSFQMMMPTANRERDSFEKKMRNRLQELEKQLLDDNEDDVGGDVAVTSSEWSETMQTLISTNNQKPFSPSPTSSSSSTSISSSPSTSTSISSKQGLIDAANAISEGKIDVAVANLDRLKQVSNPRGDPEQRLTFYMIAALKSKVNPGESVANSMIEFTTSENRMSMQLLYEASPCFKLGFMAANLTILETIKEQSGNVHVVDFDIGQGSQYMTLIHAISERQFQANSPTVVKLKITAVTDPGKDDEMKIVGDRLRKLADHVGVMLQFNVVCKAIHELNRDSLRCEDKEILVVNFAYKLYKMPDESVSLENPRDELLRTVKGLSPSVVTMVEQEMNCNTAPFVARVTELSSYYLSLFNSLDMTMSRDAADRVRIEECLGRKMANSIACEGKDRVERCEVFGKWRARMGMAGFVSRPLGQHIAEPMRSKLASAYRNTPGFNVKEEAGGICFGWMGRVLTVSSAWR